jgi:DNA invertase Pin-like site-specific DNA recombinase
MGWTIVKVYRDEGISGAKGRDGRPAFDALCKDAARRRFDMVMAWSVDRLGRSLQDLVGFLNDLHSLGIDLFLHQQGVDTTTNGGKALYQMMGVFAEFERALIRERVTAGLERAKAQGTKLGRRPIDAKKEDAIREDLRAGKVGMIKLAKAHGVGVGTVRGWIGPSPGQDAGRSTPRRKPLSSVVCGPARRGSSSSRGYMRSELGRCGGSRPP